MKKTLKRRTASLLMSVVLLVAMAGSFEVMAPTSFAASKSELEAQLQQLQQKEKEIKNKFQTLSYSILVQSHLLYSKAIDTHTSLHTLISFTL